MHLCSRIYCSRHEVYAQASGNNETSVKVSVSCFRWVQFAGLLQVVQFHQYITGLTITSINPCRLSLFHVAPLVRVTVNPGSLFLKSNATLSHSLATELHGCAFHLDHFRPNNKNWTNLYISETPKPSPISQ